MILSVDLAGRNTGWALFKDDSVHKVGCFSLELDEFCWIYMAYKSFMEFPWAGVDTLLFEFPGKWMRASKRTSTRTMEVMYSARAALIIAAYCTGQYIEKHEINPNTWQKPMFAGSPVGTKATAKLIAEQAYRHPHMTEHEHDAICMGLWWIGQRRFDGQND